VADRRSAHNGVRDAAYAIHSHARGRITAVRAAKHARPRERNALNKDLRRFLAVESRGTPVWHASLLAPSSANASSPRRRGPAPGGRAARPGPPGGDRCRTIVVARSPWASSSRYSLGAAGVGGRPRGGRRSAPGRRPRGRRWPSRRSRPAAHRSRSFTCQDGACATRAPAAGHRHGLLLAVVGFVFHPGRRLLHRVPPLGVYLEERGGWGDTRLPGAPPTRRYARCGSRSPLNSRPRRSPLADGSPQS
jgi:hypothetical protein